MSSWRLRWLCSICWMALACRAAPQVPGSGEAATKPLPNVADNAAPEHRPPPTAARDQTPGSVEAPPPAPPSDPTQPSPPPASTADSQAPGEAPASDEPPAAASPSQDCQRPGPTAEGPIRAYVGLSKAEVRACLGAPDRTESGLWHYRWPKGCAHHETHLDLRISGGKVRRAVAKRHFTGKHCRQRHELR